MIRRRSFRFGLFSLALLVGLGAITYLALAQPPGLFEFSISIDPRDQKGPDVDERIVVWYDKRNGNWDIYGYDLSTGQEFTVCTDEAEQTFPAIDGNIVVWHDRRNETPYGDIYGRDLSSGQEFTVCTTMTSSQWYVDISRPTVVWQDDRNALNENDRWDIYGYDLLSGQGFTICTSTLNQTRPAIDGNVVVWLDTRDEAPLAGNIYGYDLSSGQEFTVCTEPLAQWYADVSSPTVVWQDERNAADGSGWDIYGYDLNERQEFAICTSAFNQVYPVINGDLVVWQDYRNGNPDIYGYDLNTGQEFPICTNIGDQWYPVIDGNAMVWQDGRNGNWDIYGARLALSARKMADRDTVRPGQVLTYTIVLSNTGPITTFNTYLTDTLPTKTTYVTGSLRASQGITQVVGNELRWRGVISQGVVVNITYQVTVTGPLYPGQLLTNTALIDDGYLAPFWSNEATVEGGTMEIRLPLIMKNEAITP